MGGPGHTCEVPIRHSALGPPRLRGLVPPPGVASSARDAAEDASAPGSAAAGALDALVSASTLHRGGRFGLWHERDRALLSATPSAPDLGPQGLWERRVVRAAAPAHTPDDGTPAPQRPETGVPARGRGEHGQAHRPRGGVVWGKPPSHRERHGPGALVPYGGSAHRSPRAIRP